MSQLSHFDESGNIRMVDVAEKQITARVARATAQVLVSATTIEAIRSGTSPKGSPLEIARIAGIQAAKRTSELIPLCHQLPLSGIDISIDISDGMIDIEATAKTIAQTGVEMEALTAASVAALTIYDMLKAVQTDIVITNIRLESKTGGKADFTRS